MSEPNNSRTAFAIASATGFETAPLESVSFGIRSMLFFDPMLYVTTPPKK
jgi:hypothetical protein